MPLAAEGRPVSILMRTSAPRWLFERTMRVPYRWVECECDTGVVQIDSLHLDEAETVRRANAFYATFDDRVAHEAALLAEQGVRLVISDAPPLACAAAARAGIPSLVISNFTWDWIYSGYSEYVRDATHRPSSRRSARPIGRRRKAGGCRCMADSTRSRVSKTSHSSRATRARICCARTCSPRLDVPADRPLALSSFSHYGVNDFDHVVARLPRRTGRS